MLSVEFVGSSYGGFPCIPELINKNSVVLDFGVGEDISFAKELHHKTGCFVEVFDFTPNSISWYKKNHSDLKYIKYNDYGISNFDGMHKVYNYGGGISRRSSWMGYENNENYPVKSMKTIIDEKNIKIIDILKLDIEGEEYKVIPNLFENQIFPKQICLEEHKRFLKDQRIHDEVFELLNIFYILKGKTSTEYCFLLKEEANLIK